MKWVVPLCVVVATSVGMGTAGAQLQKIEPGFTPGEIIPFGLHHSPGGQNWQGALMKVHLFDPTEIAGGTVTLSVLQSTGGFGTAVLGLTGLPTSVSHYLSVLTAAETGIIPDDVTVNVIANLLPGGTQVGQTSDLDFSVMLFDVRHRTFSETVVFLPSAVIGGGQPGSWIHITDTTTLVRQPSDLRAFNVGNIQVGVDHTTVPEPGSMVLLSSGLVFGLIGYSIRRRRLRGGGQVLSPGRGCRGWPVSENS